MRRLSLFVAALALTLLGGATAQAGMVYQIDAGRGDGTTVGNFNNLGALGFGNALASGNTGTPLLNLVDTTGVASTYGVVVANAGSSGNMGEAGGGADYSGPHPSELSGVPASALDDGLFSQKAGGKLIFFDLDAGLTYDLLLYGVRVTNGETQTYTLESGSAASGDMSQVESTAAGSATTAEWAGITTAASVSVNSVDYSNAIVVDFSVGSNGGMLNYASLTASSVKLVGDINGDGNVDRADVAALSAGYGDPYGLDDLADVQANLGQMEQPPAAGLAAVPEPTSLALSLLGWMATVVFPRRQTARVRSMQ